MLQLSVTVTNGLGFLSLNSKYTEKKFLESKCVFNSNCRKWSANYKKEILHPLMSFKKWWRPIMAMLKTCHKKGKVNVTTKKKSNYDLRYWNEILRWSLEKKMDCHKNLKYEYHNHLIILICCRLISITRITKKNNFVCGTILFISIPIGIIMSYGSAGFTKEKN